MNTAIQLSLTPAAVAHIESILRQRTQAAGFRLSMRKYGCNGYGYVPEVVQQPQADDVEVATTASFRVFLAREYIEQLSGTEIDYVTTGLGQHQLVFRNPNTEGECGCGESVNFKKSSAKE